ncbi:MAG: LysR family transcriptional regulator [Blautia sp.]|nr:LysR family transcriptional regulator [Blautia sp.]
MAYECNISQSAISQQVQTLEKEWAFRCWNAGGRN